MSMYIDFPRKGATEFRKAQMEDPDIKSIIKSFENNDENVIRHTSRGYIMLDGVYTDSVLQKNPKMGS